MTDTAAICPVCKGRGLEKRDKCDCGTGGDIYGLHEPFCGLNPCLECNIWWQMTEEEQNEALDNRRYVWRKNA